MVSPGWKAMKTAWLACDPEWGWTFMASAPNSFWRVDGELLGNVDVLAAAVIALAGIALGVFVGELRDLAPP